METPSKRELRRAVEQLAARPGGGLLRAERDRHGRAPRRRRARARLLAVVEGEALAADDLIVLVPLAGDDDGVLGPRDPERQLDRAPPVRHAGPGARRSRRAHRAPRARASRGRPRRRRGCAPDPRCAGCRWWRWRDRSRPPRRAPSAAACRGRGRRRSRTPRSAARAPAGAACAAASRRRRACGRSRPARSARPPARPPTRSTRPGTCGTGRDAARDRLRRNAEPHRHADRDGDVLDVELADERDRELEHAARQAQRARACRRGARRRAPRASRRPGRAARRAASARRRRAPPRGTRSAFGSSTFTTAAAPGRRWSRKSRSFAST